MEPIDAVKTAKQYLSNIFADEQIAALGLEELTYDYDHDHWLATIGFARTEFRNLLPTTVAAAVYRDRVDKVVHIDPADGSVNGVTDRLLEPMA